MSDQPKTNVTLLPKGQFFITDKNGQQLKGRFSMYVLDRFCEDKKIDNYFLLLEKIVVGMKVGDYADLILLALQDYNRKKPEQTELTRDDVMDMIDEQLDGISSAEFDSLIKHAIGRVARLKEVGGQEPGVSSKESDKKKETVTDLTDGNSESGATEQA